MIFRRFVSLANSLQPNRFPGAFALGFGLILAASGCHQQADSPELGMETYRFDEGKALHPDAVASLDLAIEGAQARADEQPNSWFPLSHVAEYRMGRARLSGDLADYEFAQAAVDDAFSRAPEGGGPWLTKASLAFTLHQHDVAMQAIETTEGAILIDDPKRSAIEGLRGAIALQEGNMELAKQHLDRAEELHPTNTTASQLALWHWRTGDFETAESHYRLAASRYHGTSAEPDAWYHLQLGLLDLDQGNYEEALAHYLDANAELSGYYLVEEHVAEILVLTGEIEQAHHVYVDIIDRTGAPEFMDALAELNAEVGDDDKAEQWKDQATAAYESDLERLPEAAVGHALGHYLTFGPVDRALELAQQNYELRPNPAAAADLALAYAQSGDYAKAETLVNEALDGRWRSFDIYETGAEVLELIGQPEAAQAQMVLACEFTPARCE